MTKSMVLRDELNNRSDDEEEDNEADEDDDGGCEDSNNELSTQVPPQTPSDNRRRSMGSGKYIPSTGRVISASPSMTNDVVIKIIAVQ